MKIYIVLIFMMTNLWGGPLTSFKASLADLRQGRWQKAAGVEVGSALDRVAMDFSVTEPWRTKMQIGEWLLLAHVGRNKLDPNRDPKQKMNELEKAWMLTYSAYRDASGFVDGNSPGAMSMAEKLASLQMTSPPGPSGLNDTQRLVAGNVRVNSRISQEIPLELAIIIKSRCVELAVRMNDPILMHDSVEIYSKDAFNERELSYFVMACSHSGQWPAMARVLGRIDADRVLNVFHSASVKNNQNFDYKSICEIVKRRPGLKKMERDDLKKFREIGVESLQFRPSPSDAWTSVSGPNPQPLIQLGGAVSWVSPDSPGLPLAGIWLEGQILLHGFGEGSTGGRIEEWELKPSPNGQAGDWEGTRKVTTPDSGREPELRQVQIRFGS